MSKNTPYIEGLRGEPDREVKEAIRGVLKRMFPEFYRVLIHKELSKGFSQGRVFVVYRYRSDGMSLLPLAIKIAPAFLIEREEKAYRTYIQGKLSRSARLEGQITKYKNWAGLKYEFAGDNIFKFNSLVEYLQHSDSQQVKDIFDKIFEAMSTFWKDEQGPSSRLRDDYDPLLPVNFHIEITRGDLNNETGFKRLEAKPDEVADYEKTFKNGQKVWIGDDFKVVEVDIRNREVTLNSDSPQLTNYRIRLVGLSKTALSKYKFGSKFSRVYGQIQQRRQDFFVEYGQKILADNSDVRKKRIKLEGGSIELPNPLWKWQDILDEYPPEGPRYSPIHGDLNLENILVLEDGGHFHFIDFSDSREGRTIHDLLRLEAGIVTRLLAPTLRDFKLPPAYIYKIYRDLHFDFLKDDSNYAIRLDDLPDESKFPPKLRKDFVALKRIRKQARRFFHFPEREYKNYYKGLTIYLLGTLKFNNLSLEDKQVAFWGAATVQGWLMDEFLPIQFQHLDLSQYEEQAEPDPNQGSKSSMPEKDKGDQSDSDSKSKDKPPQSESTSSEGMTTLPTPLEMTELKTVISPTPVPSKSKRVTQWTSIGILTVTLIVCGGIGIGLFIGIGRSFISPSSPPLTQSPNQGTTPPSTEQTHLPQTKSSPSYSPPILISSEPHTHISERVVTFIWEGSDKSLEPNHMFEIHIWGKGEEPQTYRIDEIQKEEKNRYKVELSIHEIYNIQPSDKDESYFWTVVIVDIEEDEVLAEAKPQSLIISQE